MLDNFIYSLNATIPVFLVIVLGWALGRAKMLNAGFVEVANKLTYSVTLPVMLFLKSPRWMPPLCWICRFWPLVFGDDCLHLAHLGRGALVYER